MRPEQLAAELDALARRCDARASRLRRGRPEPPIDRRIRPGPAAAAAVAPDGEEDRPTVVVGRVGVGG